VSANKLIVWWSGRVVGELSRRNNGGERFTYDPAWIADPQAPPLSVSLPKSKGTFAWSRMSPFFDGLLPEGASREAIARVLQVSPQNDFSILDRLGGDVAGAIQILREGVTPSTISGPWAPDPLTDPQLLEMIRSLPLRPMLLGESGIRLSLAGAQTKLPVVLLDGRVAKPAPEQPTTHILKPAIASYRGIVENEAFCLKLARAAGLQVAGVEPRLLLVPGEPALTYLLVERYDRVIEGGHVKRLHQEDFCQALGVASRTKYQHEGGPNVKNIFEVVWNWTSVPAQNVIRLIGAVVLNVVLGNEDAHGKNFSLLFGSDGQIGLAPLYDLVSTVTYDNLARAFAMRIGRARTLQELNRHEWQRFADQAGVDFVLVRSVLTDVCEHVRRHAAEVAGNLVQPGLDGAFMEDLAATVVRRAEACQAMVAPRRAPGSRGD
jgi:serine/threonine-protein kinase HipA